MDLDGDDTKLVTLARSAVPRSRSLREGAAVRDDIGRTYVAAAVECGPLTLSALQLAVAMALSSGVTRLERAVLVTADVDQRPTTDEIELLASVGEPRLSVLIVDDVPA